MLLSAPAVSALTCSSSPCTIDPGFDLYDYSTYHSLLDYEGCGGTTSCKTPVYGLDASCLDLSDVTEGRVEFYGKGGWPSGNLQFWMDDQDRNLCDSRYSADSKHLDTIYEGEGTGNWEQYSADFSINDINSPDSFPTDSGKTYPNPDISCVITCGEICDVPTCKCGSFHTCWETMGTKYSYYIDFIDDGLAGEWEIKKVQLVLRHEDRPYTSDPVNFSDPVSDIISAELRFMASGSGKLWPYVADKNGNLIAGCLFTIEAGGQKNLDISHCLRDGGIMIKFDVASESSWGLDTVEIAYSVKECESGACCDIPQKKFKPPNSQPTGYSDYYFCSGTESPTGTSYVKLRDYYCSGSDASEHHSDSTQDTCGTCEYCIEGGQSCSYYDPSTPCGTGMECDGSGSCIDAGQCAETDASCGSWPDCSDCNSQDGCYGTVSRDYYCISNSLGCSYTPDDCSDCSCPCGGYDVPEATANGNCNDGLDNDCDGSADGADAGCQGGCVTPTDGMTIAQNTILCPGNYNLPNGIEIGSDDIFLDCDGAVLGGGGGSQQYGIEVASKSGVTIKNCNIHNYGQGIRFRYSDDNFVFYNTVWDSVTYGFVSWYSDNNQIFNNTFYQNTAGVGLWDYSNGNQVYSNDIHDNGDGIYLGVSSDSNTMEHNSLYDNAYNFRVFPGQAASAEYNWWGTTEEAEIAEKIYDCKYDADCPCVNFIPYLCEQWNPNNISPCDRLPGDANGDCTVNIFDLAAVGLCYGQPAEGQCEPADLNHDGTINIFDLATVGLNYGNTC